MVFKPGSAWWFWFNRPGVETHIGFQSFPDESVEMWTVNFQMFKLVLEKAEEPEVNLPTSTGSLKKKESSRKTSTSALLTMPKPLTVWITTNCGKFFKRWQYQTTWPASWETCIQLRKQVRTGNGTIDNFQIGKGKYTSRLYIVTLLI